MNIAVLAYRRIVELTKRNLSSALISIAVDNHFRSTPSLKFLALRTCTLTLVLSMTSVDKLVNKVAVWTGQCKIHEYVQSWSRFGRIQVEVAEDKEA